MPENLRDIFQKLEEVESIPTLPSIANKLFEMVHNYEVEIEEIVRVIEKDPSISAKVLKIANSAFYSFTKQISNIKNAIILLGLREIKNVVLSITIFRAFGQEDLMEERKKFWEHSFLTAQVCVVLAKNLDLHFSGEEFTAGLLHDIGKVIIDQFFHDEYQEIKEILKTENYETYKAEQEVLGSNHMQVGAWLAEKWSMPDEIIDVIRCHHQPDKSIYDKNLVFLVYLADSYSKNKEKKAPLDNYSLLKSMDFTSTKNKDKFNLENIKNYYDLLDKDFDKISDTLSTFF